MPVRVILLDDDERYRGRLVERLAFAPNVVVVADVGCAADFFDVIEGPEPVADVAMIDIELRGESGIDVADRLAASCPSVGILMLTVFEDDTHVLQAIQAGASGYLLKDTTVDVLAAAIHEVHDGGVPLSRGIARRILGLVGKPALQPPGGTSEGEALSGRERELLEHVVRGETEAEIAGLLGISPHTVRSHVKNIYRKLRVRSRAAAVRLAFERGLVHQSRR